MILIGAAGFECSKTLCKEGFSGRIVLISSEDFLPYDRTKLSKVMWIIFFLKKKNLI